jgi:protein required for attachment to host cells
MTLPHNALVLVVDGRKLLFLRNHGDAGGIDLRVEAHDEQALPKDSELKSDAPGTGHQSGGYGRSAVDEPDYHQQAEDRWAAEAAEALRKRALANDFDALAIIAPPRTLGELRKHLHKEVERRIIVQMPKEMTDRPVADIEALLAGEAAPPA